MKYAVYGRPVDKKPLVTFRSKKAMRAWIMEGMMCTDGAERDHYVEMLCALECGKTILYYYEY